jgi:hypothetical protein
MISKVKIGYINSRGITGVKEQLKKMVRKYDLLIVGESWLNESSSSMNFAVLDLRKEHREGVLLLSERSKHNKVDILHISSDNRWFCAQYENIFIISGYIPPDNSLGPIQDIWTYADELQVRHQDRPILIVGDFNIRLKEFGDTTNNTRGRNFWTMYQESCFTYCKPVVGRFTTTTGQSTPDQAYINNEYLSDTQVHIHDVPLLLTDHRLISVTIKTTEECPDDRVFQRLNVTRLKDREVFKRCHDQMETTYENVINEINQIHISQDALPKQTVIDQCYDKFHNWINNIMVENIGIMQYAEHLHKDYVTPTLKRLQRVVKETYTAAINSTPATKRGRWDSYYAACRRLSAKSVKRQGELFQQTCEELSHRPNDLFRFASALKKRAKRGIMGLQKNRLAEYSSHFENTFGGSPTGIATLKNQEILRDTAPENISRNTEFTPVDRKQIIEILQYLPRGKAAGADGLMTEVLQTNIKATSSILTCLFNIIKTRCCIPLVWKRALVCPVYKKGAITDIGNYRPISLTSICRRIFEREMMDTITKFDNELTVNQAGFRKRRRCTDQISLLNEVLARNPTGCYAFLDLKAAYDVIDRDILWTQLSEYVGMDTQTIAMFRELFDNNVSALIVKGKQGPDIINKRGLLQGSTLSPILFNHYINSLSKKLNEETKITTYGIRLNNLLFADDTMLAAHNKQTLQRLLDICGQWSADYGMLFAPSKCYILSSTPIRCLLYGTALPQEDQVKYLGMMFNCAGIDWKLSLMLKREAALKSITFFKSKGMNMYGLPARAAVTIYKAFIRPQLEYALCTKILNQTEIEILQKVQNLALRTVLSCARSTSTTATHKLLGIPTMKCRNELLAYNNARRMEAILEEDGDNWTNYLHIKVLRNTKAMLHSRQTPEILRLLKENQFNHFLIEQGIARWKEVKDKYILESVNRLCKPGDIGDSIRFTEVAVNDLYNKHCWLNQEAIRHITLWRIGRLSRHVICDTCGEVCDREHVLLCSGAQEQLEKHRNWLKDPIAGTNIMDQLLNQLTFHKVQKTSELNIIDDVLMCIQAIEHQCMGIKGETTPLRANTHGRLNKSQRKLVQARQEILLRQDPSSRTATAIRAFMQSMSRAQLLTGVDPNGT